MEPVARQVYESALADMRAAERAGSPSSTRSAIVEHAAGILGVSVKTVYSNLKKLGWASGRKERSDKGDSKVKSEDLRQVATWIAKARDKRGDPNLTVKEAHLLAQEQGLPVGQISYGHTLRRLRQEGMDLRRMRAPEASIARVSSHPNHVWQFDISIARQWYFKGKEGKRLAQYMDAGARFYKPEHFKDVQTCIHRFLVVDHYSGAWFVRYYDTAGERAEDVIDFFYRAMSTKDEVSGSYPFRGVPRRMVMDPGPANKSALVCNLLRELGVTFVEHHKARNAKATGSVESRHWHWERPFEGRLALCPAENLADLNRFALRFCALMNQERPHTRHGRPPMDLWATITAEQLREAPDRETFLQLAATTAKTGTLDNRLWLRAKGRTWLIRGENIYPGQKVEYRLSPFISQGIRVSDDQGRELAAEEIRFDPVGFPQNGRLHVWDDEEHRGATAPAPVAQQISREVVTNADLVRVEGLFDDLDERLARKTYLTRQGQEWAGNSPLAQAPVLGLFEVIEEVARRLGRPLGGDGAWWHERIGGGLTASELEAAWNEWTMSAAEAAGR